VTKLFLYGADVHPALEQMGRERVPERVAGGGLVRVGHASSRSCEGITGAGVDGNP